VRRNPIRVEVERCPNPDVFQVHVTERISRTQIARFDYPLEGYKKKDLQKVGNTGEAFVRRIMRIKGIKGLSITPYELQIERAHKMFDLKGIIKQVEKAVLSVDKELREAKEKKKNAKS
jgi:hypothetical protein